MYVCLYLYICYISEPPQYIYIHTWLCSGFICRIRWLLQYIYKIYDFPILMVLWDSAFLQVWCHLLCVFHCVLWKLVVWSSVSFPYLFVSAEFWNIRYAVLDLHVDLLNQPDTYIFEYSAIMHFQIWKCGHLKWQRRSKICGNWPVKHVVNMKLQVINGKVMNSEVVIAIIIETLTEWLGVWR